MKHNFNIIKENELVNSVGGITLPGTLLPSATPCSVNVNDLDGHFGSKINKYESASYIGYQVIIKSGNLHYLGFIVSSKDESYLYFWRREGL